MRMTLIINLITHLQDNKANKEGESLYFVMTNPLEMVVILSNFINLSLKL